MWTAYQLHKANGSTEMGIQRTIRGKTSRRALITLKEGERASKAQLNHLSTQLEEANKKSK